MYAYTDKSVTPDLTWIESTHPMPGKTTPDNIDFTGTWGGGICEGAFQNEPAVTKITFGGSNAYKGRYICDYAFADDINLANITQSFPYTDLSLQSIGNYAFNNTKWNGAPSSITMLFPSLSSGVCSYFGDYCFGNNSSNYSNISIRTDWANAILKNLGEKGATLGCGSASTATTKRVVHYGKGFVGNERNTPGIKIFQIYNTDDNVNFLPTFDKDAFIDCHDPEKTYITVRTQTIYDAIYDVIKNIYLGGSTIRAVDHLVISNNS
jgi:hypothetical protein